MRDFVSKYKVYSSRKILDMDYWLQDSGSPQGEWPGSRKQMTARQWSHNFNPSTQDAGAGKSD